MRLSKETIVISIVSIVFIAGMAFLIWYSPKLVPQQQATAGIQLTAAQMALLVHPTSHMTGNINAKVTMVEFGDYECPACGEAYPIVKQVTDYYASNPNFDFVFRNFPLPQHPNAPIAAEAAEAAGAQGKYWQMHDALYTNQNEWADSTTPLTFFDKYATAIGLNLTEFNSDVNSNKYASVISADQDDGNQLGVDATPTIYINGQMVTTFTADAMESTINADLAK